MKNFSMLLLSAFLFSCQQKENKSAPVPTSDSIITKKEVTENKQVGDTIYMDFKNEKGLFIAEGVIDSIHPRVYVKFKNEDSGNLTANIIPTTGKGNIRFNQIISPDNASDGPFGMDLNIALQQKGNYIIVIGHSQMADSPYWGKFKVKMESKKE
ncbi:hypothetical protein [Flavobacterium sp. SLB02]|uniref:hypothetical protein n=1 Tax=Flavobacterium sp. SLB02 TaxID=2665645 RepID=UPI0012A96B80|nr:hypothetical protein [Flavobacterium sp. SLB02]QGK74274.1 hypothetical protein GIY83_09470 [Flavobacterium sp. SLB02]